MSQIVDYFKKRTKSLLTEVEAGNAEAVARVTSVLHQGTEGLGLMKAQHVIAVESGFKSWDQFLQAPEIELRLVATMTEHADLNSFGIEHPTRNRHLPQEEREAMHQQNRAELRQSVRDVEWTVGWVAQLERTETINMQHTSYGLKHMAERSSPEKYLTNGTFIAAAIIAGFKFKIFSESPNVSFGMSERSIRSLAHGKPWREPDPMSFTAWISRHTKRHSPLGDLAGDWMDDYGRVEPTSREELVSYLSRKHASFEALDAARGAWRSYTAWLKRQASPPAA